MRWDGLFDDLEADFESMRESERDAEIADRTRARAGELTWVERCAGSPVRLRVQAVGVLSGVVDTVTTAWVLLHASESTDWVVSRAAVTGVLDVPAVAVGSPAGEVARRMTWLNAWAVLARDRDPVHVVRLDGTTVAGVAGRVGKDFVELGAELVPYAAIAAVRCRR